MKWIYRLFTLAILGVALGLPFFMDNKQGEPMLSLPSASDLLPSKSVLENPTPAALMGNRTVYKWQDNQGGWHYGDTPPPDAKQISAITVNTNTNKIQSIPKEEEKKPEEGYTPPTDDNLLSFERAKNILKETKEVAAMMEARNAHLGQLVGEEPKQ